LVHGVFVEEGEMANAAPREKKERRAAGNAAPLPEMLHRASLPP
jgi:hypothetical protein